MMLEIGKVRDKVLSPDAFPKEKSSPRVGKTKSFSIKMQRAR